MAASEAWREGGYSFAWADEPMTSDALATRYRSWIDTYGLYYVEDAFAATESAAFAALTAELGGQVKIAGDDLYASNSGRIADGVRGGWSNAVVVKPNQAGTVTGTLSAAASTHAGDLCLLVSQRSGENDSSFLSSLAIAVDAAYVKVGGPSRIDRIIKINELLRVSVGG
jgi:enolase